MALTSDGTPWFRGPDRRDGFAAAVAIASAYALDWEAALEAIGYVDNFELGDEIDPSDVYPPGAYFVGERFVVIVLAGITTPSEIIAAVTTTNQVVTPGITGKVASNWSLLAQGLWGRWGVRLGNDTLSRKLVFLGHSLGGATVTTLAALFQFFHPDRQFVVHTFGAPRPGNAEFAASIESSVVRWVNEGDPVPEIPPQLWNGIGSHFPQPGPPPFAFWAQPDLGWTITADGSINPVATQLGFAEVVVKIVSNDLSDHYIQTSATRLQLHLTLDDLIEPAASYHNGSFLLQRYEFLTYTQGAAMADYSQLAFTFTGKVPTGAVGWEEIWWTNRTSATGNGQAMYDLAKLRTQFLFGSATLNKAVLRLFPSTRIVETVVANLVGSSDSVNDWNNCAVYQGVSGNNKTRSVHFHGIFDEAVQGQALTSSGASTIDNKAKIFNNAMKAFGGGIRYRSKTLTVPIQSASVNPTAGTLSFVVSTTAGYSPGDTILVSRYKPAPLLNGIWVVQGIDSTTLTVAMGTRTLGVGNIAPSGTISKLTYAVNTFQAINGPFFGEKKIGRPTTPYRGRTKQRVFHS
jgi:hypothetical protein